MKAVKILTEALELLKINGWIKNMEADGNGAHCMIGAVRAVTYDDTRTNEVCDFLAYSVDPDFEPKHEFGVEVIAPWNDLKSTDFKDVEKAFKDAIKRAKNLKL